MCFLCILYFVRIYSLHYLYLWLTRLTYFFTEASDVKFTIKQNKRMKNVNVTFLLLYA